MQIRLDHAVIHVSDWSSSNDFYRRVLGAELIGEPDGPCRYRFVKSQLNVHGPGVEEAIEHLGRQGVEIEEGPVERHGAGGPGTSVYFRDPDGSLLEFISYAA